MKVVVICAGFFLVCLAVFYFAIKPPPPSDVPIIAAAEKVEVAKKTVGESKKQVARAEAITKIKKAHAAEAIKIYEDVIETPDSTDLDAAMACDNALTASVEEVDALQFENDALKAEIIDHGALEEAMTEHGEALAAQNAELKADNAEMRGKLEMARYGLIILGIAGGLGLHLLFL